MSKFFPRLFALFNVVFFYSSCFAHAATLAADEVEVLRQIAKTLGKTNWDFSVDPCSGMSNWSTPNATVAFENAVVCDCSGDTVCHVTEIVLKSQNLPGVLPPDLVKLSHLQNIDLSRNYLSGTIPPAWGSMKLVHISLLGNRLTGPIPNTFGNITTLVNISMEFNQLSGPLPGELGNLRLVERLHLTSNNFTGELPASLAKLIGLKQFLIGDNQFTGSIPGFIQNWTNLEMLVIQGSGLSGPIPPGIASLTKLSDLRISDLNGTEAKFPPLDNVKNLTILILRSCNIVGAIPPYLGTMPYLKTLDLSFNKLNGEIPSSFASQSKTKYLYLTGNLLSRCGSLCDSRPNDRRNIDLSYNNFSSYNKFSSIFQSCQQNVNLFDSSVKDNRLGVVSCLGSFYCPRTWDSLHINCGGGNVTHDGITYEEDSDPGGPSKFYNGGPNWAFSSTGHFLDNKSAESFIFRSSTSLPINTSSLNMEARGSPLSLTYYAFCLINGNYTVKLHFTEVVFTDDKTYYSLGRRIFDVHVQGTRVLKDFNIENAAGGVRKEIIKNFTAIVTNGTLEIRFYWAGKGTTSLPDKGVYGPLISAISVKSDPVPPSDGKLSMGVLAGIVAAVVSSIILLLGILWWFCFLRPKYTMKQDLKGLDLQTGSFTLRQIRAATNNFDTANKIGEGGFGSVYKGLLSDGTLIAVKQLSSKSKQGNHEFVNEIGMISALQHPHLVKLYGCCIDGNQLLLVYEYMENNSLSRALFGPEECQLNLDWSTRYKICIGIARGMSYLHEESRLKIVHRDIKASNVLLDKDLNPKISDFGLAKLDDEENTHISTRIAGTYGYMAPEYAMHGYLTYKADVYSFGIVALEIVSGRCNASNRTKENSFYILDWAHDLKKKGNLMELVDPRLGSDFDREEVMVMINVALLCTDVLLAVRPAMSSVVSMLEGRMVLHELISEPTVSSTGIKPESIEENRNDRQIPSVSVDRPLTASSASAGDLYPVNLDSAYLLKRE